MRKRLAAGALCLGLGIAAAVSAAQAEDRHAGYYYPEPASREVYQARSQTLPAADRAARIGFVTGIAKHISEQPYPPQAVMFAKGTEAEKLIIVALVDNQEATLKRYRRKGSMIALEAANPAYETRLLPEDRVRIQGRLVGLIRSY